MLNQPSENVKLPDELEAAVKRAKNLVTITEAEALRLQEIITGLQYTINQLHNQKVELDDIVALKKEALETVQSQLKEAEEQVGEKRGLLETLNKEMSKLDEVRASEATVRQQLADEETRIKAYEEGSRKQLAVDEARVNDREVELKSREAKCQEVEQSLADSKKRLKEFADSLCS